MREEPATPLARDAAQAVAASRGAPLERMRLTPVVSRGGFANISFVATDGERRWFLKLGGDAEATEKLRRWRNVAPLLAARYGAPEMLDWIRLPASGHEGALFELIDGVTPTERSAALDDAMVAIVERLHADAELAALLQREQLPMRCADAYLTTYSTRFRDDIDIVAASPPPFVSDALLRYLRAEVGTLELLVLSSSSFDVRARWPVHGDLWLDNLLVVPGAAPRILDWDDLAIGDAAIDWAIFFGPSPADLSPVDVETLPVSIAADRHLVERLVILARASLLDWVIDPLADYVEAGDFPVVADEVRAEKERVHRAALARYRSMYGG